MVKTIEDKAIDILGGLDAAKNYIHHCEQGIDSCEQTEKLFELFTSESNEMPYGTAKARTEDPYEWIYNRIYSIIQQRNHRDT